MADKLTPQQAQAVRDRGGRLLVSAAAGSGKTAVLVQRVIIVGGWRGAEEREHMERAADHLRACGCGVELIAFDPVEISSTDLRQKLARGEDTGAYLPEAVKKYIREHVLYRD